MSKSVGHSFYIPGHNVRRFELTFLQDVVPHTLELDSEIKTDKLSLIYCKYTILRKTVIRVLRFSPISNI